jgi:uncharacterized Zn finger protein
MMKVLAAEMSDPQRLRRGKLYAKNDSVLDIIIEPGTVTCEVQGSRSTPYIATIEVTPGSGMPLRRDITKRCNCPDDDNWDDYACKHVVAAMFTISDEFLLEPELLDLWRNNDVESTQGDLGEDDSSHDASESSKRHLTLVPSPPAMAAADLRDQSRRTHGDDPIRDLLKFPKGSELPAVPRFEPFDSIQPKSRELAAILRDALANLRVEWD